MVSRVSTAAVTVDGAVVGEIGRGLLSLVGVGRDDDVDAAPAHWPARSTSCASSPASDGEVSAADLGLPVLVVSQFTLYADTRKGRRPSWQDAAPGEVAEPLVEEVVGTAPARLHRRDRGVRRPHAGRSVNEGPMTLLLET